MLSDTPVLPPRGDYAKGGKPYRNIFKRALAVCVPCLYRHHPYGQETHSLSHLLQFNDPRLHPEICNFWGSVLLLCAGFDGCVWKMGCPLWRIRSLGVKGIIRTTANGYRTGRGRLTFRINCGWQSTRCWQSAQALWRLSSPLWNRLAMKSRRSGAAACLSGWPDRGRNGLPACGPPRWGKGTT